MASQRSSAVHAPKTVEEIVKEARNFDHESEYPLRIALRTAQNIHNQAVNYERDGNIQDAYLFLYRHAEFCMTRISTHADRKNPEHKQALTRVNKEVNADLARLEELKPALKKRYERYQESVTRLQEARAERRRQEDASAQRTGVSRDSFAGDGAVDEPRLYSTSTILNAGEHSDLALQLAQRESRRRRPDRHGAREVDELSQGIRDLGRKLGREGTGSTPTATDRSSRYAYPSVPAHEQARRNNPLSLPPKTPLSHTVHAPTAAPAIPSKSTLFDGTVPPPLSGKALPSKDSAAPGDVASSDYTFKAAAFAESGAPLRTLFLPTELRTRFLSLASSNTQRKLETCGILCGTLISNALFISHLVIPDQVSTSDTCDTTDEGDSALFDYVDGEELMVCGWIHTHPTQTCFLSSRDLHTSVGYQVMLPESVAIVCAPSQKPDHGIFRLTDPPGKQAILNCHQSGLFHPHAQTNLYTDASRPGHVSELQGLQFQVVDLRKK